MKQNINKTFAVVLAVMFLIPAVSFAEPSVTDGGNGAIEAGAPSVSSQGGASVVSDTPAVTNQGSGAVVADTGTPNTTSQGNGAVVADPGTPAVTSQGNGAVVADPGTPNTTSQGNGAVVKTDTNTGGENPEGNPTPDTNTTKSDSTSGGRGYGGGGGGYIVASPIIVAAPTSCIYLNDYLKLEGNNSTVEVTKLQTFLKNIEGLNVDINGTFDEKTFEAVKAFQAKYLDETMIPWGVTTPTGQVYFTTKNKINEIYCKSIIGLSSEQLSAIEKYKLSLLDGTATDNDNNSSTTDTTVGKDTSGTSTSDQIAAAGNTSFLSRLWNFIKRLFGR